MSPYRTPATTDAPRGASEEDERCPDGDLGPVLFVFWVASIVRVTLAVGHPEAWGAEATLAAIAVGVIPYLSKDAVAWWFRRRR